MELLINRSKYILKSSLKISLYVMYKTSIQLFSYKNTGNMARYVISRETAILKEDRIFKIK